MKKLLTTGFLLLGMLLLSSCLQTGSTVSPVKEPERSEPSYIFTATDPADLEPVSRFAVDLLEMAKRGDTALEPYININRPGIDIENRAGGSDFMLRNIMILSAETLDDGGFSQRMLTESTDRNGRIDLRDERIAFRVRDANPEEAAMIAGDILEEFSKGRINRMPKADRETFKEGIKAYQTANDLKPDGIFGKNTAASMGAATAVVDIEQITSRLVYPSTPRHAVYIVPLPVVEENPGSFYKGFDSRETVEQSSIGPEGFAGFLKQDAGFVAFIYFFDRVDPERPLSIRLSAYKQKAVGEAGQKWHAAPGKWPVVVETFTLDKIPKTSLANLYLNVFIRDGKADRCISSYQIQ